MWKKEVIFLTAVICGFAFMIIGMCMVGNQPEIYTALIDGLLSQYITNKSGELSLFWKMTFVGSSVLALLFFLFKAYVPADKSRFCFSKKETRRNMEILGAGIVALCIGLAVNGTVPQILLAYVIVLLAASVFTPKEAVFELGFFIVSFYSAIGLSYVANRIFGFVITTGTALTAAAVLTIVTFVMNRIRADLQKKVFLIIQLFIPLVLLQYYVSDYTYQGQTVKISVEPQMIILTAVFFCVLETSIIRSMFRNWNHVFVNHSGKLISIASCISISIFAFNRGEIKSLTGDVHHSGELLVAYQQIVEQGQTAYQNYSPASGLYAVFIGAVNRTLGGKMTSVWTAAAIIAIITVVVELLLLKKLLGNSVCLYLAAAVSMVGIDSGYSRANWILLSVLVLMQPKLRENINRWLKAWVLLSLFSGLFYPLFGVAVCLGAAPFGIGQIIRYVSSGKLKEDSKKPSFYIGWIFVLTVVGIFVPTLWRMANHIFAYASQSVMSDGISVFGQNVPDYFMPYIAETHTGVRKALYYSVRYVLPAVFVWFFVCLLAGLWKKYKAGGKKFMETETFLLLSYGLIALPISYTFTLVRADRNYILCRTGYVAVPFVAVALIIVTLKEIEVSRVRSEIIGFCLGVTLILGFGNLNNIDSHLNYSYSVSDGSVPLTEEYQQKYPNIGPGFAESWMLQRFDSYSAVTSEILSYTPDTVFYGLDYVDYVVLDIKTCGQTSFSEAQSMAAVKRNIEVFEKEKPVIFLSHGVSNSYYLYYWVMQNEEYAYVPKYEAFLPESLIEKIPGIETADKREFVTNGVDFAGTPNSFGRSYDSLVGSVLTETEIQAELTSTETQELPAENGNTRAEVFRFSTEQSFKGTDADYIYLEFSVDNKEVPVEQSAFGKRLSLNIPNRDVEVTVYFTEGNQVNFECGDGKLLFPVGANNKWLLNEHDFFSVRITGLADDADVTFHEVKLLKSDAQKLFE